MSGCPPPNTSVVPAPFFVCGLRFVVAVRVSVNEVKVRVRVRIRIMVSISDNRDGVQMVDGK